MIRPIVKYGDPVLQSKAAPVQQFGEDLARLIRDHQITDVIDLSSLDTVDCARVCDNLGADFLCTSVEEWAGHAPLPTDRAIRRLLPPDRPSVERGSYLVGSGANPGLVNALVFTALDAFASRVGVDPTISALDVRAILDDLPGMEDDDAVEVGDRGQAVCDDDGRAALHELRDALLNVPLGHRVEAGRRLVQEEDRRVLENGPGDRDPLALATAELMRIALGVGRIQSHRFQQIRNFRASGRLIFGQTMDVQSLTNDVFHRHPRVQRAVGILEDNLHPAAERSQFTARQVEDRLAVERHATAGRWNET